MKIRYHNVRDSFNYVRINHETVILDNISLQDFHKCTQQNDNVQLFDDIGRLIREFHRYETEVNYTYAGDNKDPGGHNVFKWTRKDDVRYEETHLYEYFGNIGKYEFTCSSGDWFITGKKMQDSRIIVRVVDGKVQCMLKKFYNYGVENEWLDVDTDWKVDIQLRNYCKKIVVEVVKEIKKLDIDEDLKEHLCKIMTVKENK